MSENMSAEKNIKVCPHCNSESGFYTRVSGVRFYNWNGKESGCNLGSESEIAHCISCGAEIELKKHRKN